MSMDVLQRFAIFLIPMLIAFFVLWLRYGVTQAILDLLAFNLCFDFDFAALMPGNIKVSMTYLLVIALTFVLLFKAIRSGRIQVNRTALFALSVSLLIALWIGVAFLVNRAGKWSIDSIVIYVIRVYWLHILLILVGMVLARRNQLKRFVAIFLAAALLVSIVSIIQTASDGQLLTHDRSDYYLGFLQPLGDKSVNRRDYTEQSVGFINAVQRIRFGSISFYRSSGTSLGSGEQLGIAAIITLYLALTKRRSKALYLSLSSLYLVGLITTFGRTQISIVFAVCFLLIIRFWKRFFSLSMLFAILIVLILAIGVTWRYFEPISTVVLANLDGFTGDRGGKEVGSLNGRTSLWLYVGSQIIKYPVFGSAEPITFFRAGWAIADDIDIGAHNSFLDLTYRTGVIPGLLFLWLYLLYLWRAFKFSSIKAIPTETRSVFVLLVLTGIILLVTQSMTTDLIFSPQVAALFWIPCGYVMAYQIRRDVEPHETSTLSNPQLASTDAG